jgi:hypothetical protein
LFTSWWLWTQPAASSAATSRRRQETPVSIHCAGETTDRSPSTDRRSSKSNWIRLTLSARPEMDRNVTASRAAEASKGPSTEIESPPQPVLACVMATSWTFRRGRRWNPNSLRSNRSERESCALRRWGCLRGPPARARGFPWEWPFQLGDDQQGQLARSRAISAVLQHL